MPANVYAIDTPERDGRPSIARMLRSALAVGATVFAVAALVLGLWPPLTEAGTRSAADRLWNKGFVATAIEADRPTPFSHPGQIKVFFYAEGWYPDAIEWYSPCRHSSLPARVGRHRIWVSRPEDGWDHQHCTCEPDRRSRWLARFFRSDPLWQLAKGRLSLQADHSIIRLRSADVLHGA